MPKTIDIPENIQTLGEALRFLREKREMSLRALAKKVGVSAPFLSDLEHNRRSTNELPAFAKALDVDPAVLSKFDGRLTSDMKEWISSNPALVNLLKDFRSSGRRPEELREALASATSGKKRR